MEDDRSRIGGLPAPRQLRHAACIGVRSRECHVEEIGEPRSVGVRAEARIETLWVTRQREYQGTRGGRRLCAAAEECGDECNVRARFD
jgi:hypothetical protein